MAFCPSGSPDLPREAGSVEEGGDVCSVRLPGWGCTRVWF